jgi:microcompartment protein CcmL/EutN
MTNTIDGDCCAEVERELEEVKKQLDAANAEIVKCKTTLSNSVTVQYHEGVEKELAHERKVVEVLAEKCAVIKCAMGSGYAHNPQTWIEWARAKAKEV